MKHLTIDNGNYIENVTNKLVKGLYNLTNASDYIDGELKGTIIVDNAYQSEVDDLEERFPDLHIEIEIEPYIDDDPKFKSGFASMGDGIGITETMRPNIKVAKGFSGNTQITNTDFLLQFPGLTTIGSYCFNQCSNLYSAVIPNTVTTIEPYAFLSCKELLSVTIPDSVTSIANYAFYDCEDLISITLPNNITSILDYAFSSCDNLASVIISNSVTNIGEGAFSYSGLTSFTIPENITVIKRNTFDHCTKLATIIIPDNITSIEYLAFNNCSNLASAVIGNSVLTIGDRAFFYCTSLASILIPNSVTSIGEYAFGYCNNLTSVIIGNNIETIGLSAFDYDSNLTSVYISDLKAWCDILFSNVNSNPTAYAKHLYLNENEIIDLVIPNTVTNIKLYAFYNCASLTSVTIPNSVTSIGLDAFYGCTGLTSVIIPDSVTYLNGFGYCSNLTSLTIPNSVTTIGKNAFAGSKVGYNSSFIIPNSVTDIDYGAFRSCNMSSITIPGSVTSIKGSNSSSVSGPFEGFYGTVIIEEGVERIEDGINYSLSLSSLYHGAFVSATINHLYVPSTLNYIGKFSFYKSSGHVVDSLHISDLSAWCNIDFKSANSNPLYNAFHFYLGENEITNLVIPDDITVIKDYSFAYSPILSVTIHANVTEIGSYAFNGSKLLSVTFNEGLVTIKNYSFYKCLNLTSIIIPNSVTTIGSNAFNYCERLASITIGSGVNSINYFEDTDLLSIVVNSENTTYDSRDNCNAVIKTETNELIIGSKNTIIPNSVTSIGPESFHNILVLITIPTSVTNIKGYAFRYVSNGSSVTFLSETPPTIGVYAFKNSNFTIYVPSLSVDTYKTASGWTSYANLIQAIQE